MSIEIESTIDVPRTSDVCVAFSLSAAILLDDPAAWLHMQQTAADALIRSQVSSGADVAALFAIRKGLSDDGEPVQMIAMMFVGSVDPGELEPVWQSMRDSDLPWREDGVQPIPDEAFPSLAYVGGSLYQVWLSSPAGIAALVPAIGEEGAMVTKILAEDAEPGQFLPTVRHAKATPGDRRKQLHSRSERLKAAFSIRVCESIVNADGVRHKDEISFVERTFHERLLRSLDLLDPDVREELYEEAASELSDLIDDDEKLGLVGLFYRVCQADGFIDDREMDALTDACRQLGLSTEQIDDHVRTLD